MLTAFPLRSSPAMLLCLSITASYAGCVIHPSRVLSSKEQLIEQENERTAKTEEAIKNSPKLRELDNLCKEIPLPSDFKFVAKDMGMKRTYIVSFYESSTDYEALRENLLDYFNNNNWTRLGSEEFGTQIKVKKGDYYIALFHGGLGEADYALHCEKLD